MGVGWAYRSVRKWVWGGHIDRYIDGCVDDWVESDGIACHCGCLDRRTSDWVGGCFGRWNKKWLV